MVNGSFHGMKYTIKATVPPTKTRRESTYGQGFHAHRVTSTQCSHYEPTVTTLLRGSLTPRLMPRAYPRVAYRSQCECALTSILSQRARRQIHLKRRASYRGSIDPAPILSSLDPQYAFEQAVGKFRAGQIYAGFARQLQRGRQACGEDLGAFCLHRFGFFRSFELVPHIEHIALAGADVQNFLEFFEIEPGLVTQQLALMRRDHVQANDDLDEHLRGGAGAELA